MSSDPPRRSARKRTVVNYADYFAPPPEESPSRAAANRSRSSVKNHRKRVSTGATETEQTPVFPNLGNKRAKTAAEDQNETWDLFSTDSPLSSAPPSLRAPSYPPTDNVEGSLLVPGPDSTSTVEPNVGNQEAEHLEETTSTPRVAGPTAGTPSPKEETPHHVVEPSNDTISNVSFQESEESLSELAKYFMHASSVDPKPEPFDFPDVWAPGRQELCETLPYFRAWQSSAYFTGGFALAFLFDKSSNPRDYSDSNVVIVCAGGGRTQDAETGQMVLAKDHSATDKAEQQSMRNSMASYNTVVLIAGEDNRTLPSKPPYVYNVMDHFKPTHIWREKHRGKAVIRYRFEKHNPEKPSWWQAKGVKDPIALGQLSAPLTAICTSCKQSSEQVYLQGWMCWHSSCPRFWKLADGTEPEESELLYDPRFLKQKTIWPNDGLDFPLKPDSVELSGYNIPGEDCTRTYWCGIVCPDCGRCIMRISFTAWECPCGFAKRPQHTLVPAKALHEPYFQLSEHYTKARDVHIPEIGVEITFKHNYRIHKYTIPGIDGFVAHLYANKTINEEPNGPDALFEEIQSQDIGLCRRSLGHNMTKGEGFTRNFTVNYGMPYKFIAATTSHSFDGAANPIRATRTRLNWAAKMMVPRYQEINEILVLAYLEEQKIKYHDDGEFGLGPTISTISLGAPGTMKLRMKGRHYNGISKVGIYNDEPPKPGCIKYQERVALHQELADLKAKNPGQYRARLKTVGKDMGLKASGTAKDAITMTLGHGDIIIMHGEDIQKYYEHSVENGGKLRFAFTGRYIDPDSLKDGDKPTYEVHPDEGFYDGALLGKKGSATPN